MSPAGGSAETHAPTEPQPILLRSLGPRDAGQLHTAPTDSHSNPAVCERAPCQGKGREFDPRLPLSVRTWIGRCRSSRHLLVVGRPEWTGLPGAAPRSPVRCETPGPRDASAVATCRTAVAYTGPPGSAPSQLTSTASATSRDRDDRTRCEVAPLAGYDSDASFSKAFRREFGVPPGAYRRSSRERPAVNAALIPDARGPA